MPLIALVHGLRASMAPAEAAFAAVYPEATLWNLLDDRLMVEAEAAGGLTRPLRERMGRLIDHAVTEGADAVLLTCSLYGPAAGDAAKRHAVPVLASDQALFAAVRDSRAKRVAVFSPLAAAVKDTIARLGKVVDESVRLNGYLVERAREAAAAGDLERLGEVVAAAAAGTDADLVVLGQYSLAPALAAAQAAVAVPVMTAPHLAAERLRELLEES